MIALTCEKNQLLFPEWLAGELDEARAAAVRDHLAECAACRAEEAGMRQVLAMLSADAEDAGGLGGVPDPGEAYWQAFAGRVRTARAARDLATPLDARAWWRRLAPRAAAGLAAAALAAVVLRAPVPVTVGAPDPDAELLSGLLVPPAEDRLGDLDGEALARVEEALTLTAVLDGDAAPDPAPAGLSAAGAGMAERGNAGGLIDDIAELSPEELELLLERLEGMET